MSPSMLMMGNEVNMILLTTWWRFSMARSKYTLLPVTSWNVMGLLVSDWPLTVMLCQ